jgi:hypothetical protein
MTNIKADKIEMIILDRFEGVKYTFILGQHFNGKQLCFDIAILNTWSNALLKLHFSTKEECNYKWEQIKQQLDAIDQKRSKLLSEEDKLVNLSKENKQ